MNTGVGFGEILVILFIILLFFGSKELPRFVREIAAITAKVRRYSDRIRRELDDLSRPLQEALPAYHDSTADRKKELRSTFRTRPKALSPEQRQEKSRSITESLLGTEEFRKARSLMVYVGVGVEVDTSGIVARSLELGKRVVVPYCVRSTTELGLAEITDPAADLLPGEFGLSEPAPAKRDNFFKSDLQLVVCPGVAFDRRGGRLGRGKAYYDKFLKDLKGRIPILAVAFDCQIMDESLPFAYHDVSMDDVITETGRLLHPAPSVEAAAPTVPPVS